MFSLKNTPLKTSGVLNSLVQDYIDRKENLNSYSGDYPDFKGFENLLGRNIYSSLDRNLLFDILRTQAVSTDNTSSASLANIELLKDKNTFTVTTGHQLCLFTGPLYFIYKIFSVINLAEELEKKFPAKKFIPVYWSASEDHDFEEVNHFHLFGKKVIWESSQTGAVGDFKTKELETILPQLKEILGTSENANYLIELFEKAYFSQNNLASATRYLVNELFGEYGLVTVDGNDKRFKQQIKELLRKDIFDNSSEISVNKSIKALEESGYKIQVNPRAINCFLMEDGTRARIEKENNNYKLVGTEKTFTKEQLDLIIENKTEKISPNVVLRPLYQQQILPNIAYVGGPGELAYWLEYKAMFDEYKILYPVLVPRSFVTLIDKNTKSKADKLELSIEDLFKSEQELTKHFLVRSNNVFDVDAEKKQVETVYSELAKKIAEIDKTLVNTVSAEQQKTLNSLEALNAKANKALKQKSDTEINQLKTIKEKLFPGGVPQERHDNFATFYVKWGKEMMSALKHNIHPLSLQHSSIIED